MIKHLGLIMDGNRRWAIQHGLETFLGHKEGVKAVDISVDFAIKNGIKYLTLYAFSIENLARSVQEKDFLFDILIEQTGGRLSEFKEKDVSVKFKGDYSLFPERIIKSCKQIEKETEACKKLQVNILFCYGGQQEIIFAAKKLAMDFKNGLVQEAEIEQSFKDNLWCNNFPAPDLIIRSGGKKRLSNFLTFQSAYSELMFVDTLWPDITDMHLEEAVQEFNSTKRNFGK
jgi:undecaprenyl diphosphate synthase